ncbi:hypothetical protein EVAR_49516_1 [Eumeta japonica]|uniref:Uncharacterized protein n=1 Tax=Eumeta variegata TaxID=151549 RepID=A0A4C1VV50_EUMVA|nr:hypothetical protein EVAR_49516_1 [Eumeta japonica]
MSVATRFVANLHNYAELIPTIIFRKNNKCCVLNSLSFFRSGHRVACNISDSLFRESVKRDRRLTPPAQVPPRGQCAARGPRSGPAAGRVLRHNPSPAIINRTAPHNKSMALITSAACGTADDVTNVVTASSINSLTCSLTHEASIFKADRTICAWSTTNLVP